MRYYFLLIFLISVCTCRAQTFAEFFKQKKTQTKYSLAQIVALKAYSIILNDGYDLSGDSLNRINGNKASDYAQHNERYQSLKRVAPALRGNEKINTCVGYAEKAGKLNDKIVEVINSTIWLSSGEKKYARKVLSLAIEDCEEEMDALQQVCTDGHWEMSDDERIANIDRIFAKVKDIYTFLNVWCNSIQLLTRGRARELNDVNWLKRHFPNP